MRVGLPETRRGTGRADRGLGRRWVGLYLAQPRAIMKETYEWQQ